MPKQTFFNLPEEKRQKLLAAVRAEFSRVPFEEVSINQIIHLAGIPRGSFYQYFENKQDVLLFLLSEYRNRMLRQVEQSLARSEGDLFVMLLDLLDLTHDFLSDRANSSFCRNIFSDVRKNIEFLEPHRSEAECTDLMHTILKNVNYERLDLQSPDDFDNMLCILIPFAGHTLAMAFYEPDNYDSVRAKFAARLDLLQRGFCKNTNEKTGCK